MARNSKYDWNTWFGQNRTVLHRGTDYHISQSMMFQSIKNNAYRRGFKVNVTDHNDYIVIEVLSRPNDKVSHTDKTAIGS